MEWHFPVGKNIVKGDGNILQLVDFDYYLPQELIAQQPPARRDGSRLLVIAREKNCFYHQKFCALAGWLNRDDLLVFNDTRVMPARLWGQRLPGGGKTEVLLLQPVTGESWEVLVRPGRKVKTGQRIYFGGGKKLAAVVEERTSFGGRVLCFNRRGLELRACFKELGEVPLPPYIKHPIADRERYQTVYARYERSAAAPTAGLHFTPEILERIKDRGVKTAFLTLHIGLGTFRPVKTTNIEEHRMHAEYYRINQELAQSIMKTRRAGGRVVAVGTTATRALETAGRDDGTVPSGEGWTDLFIYPGYRFKVVNSMVTNFHLPRSTLLMMISAFAGRERVLSAYEEAVRRSYRFFSFGDAMLIV